MIEGGPPIFKRASPKGRNDVMARRLTATAGAAAFGLAGVLVGLVAAAPKGGTAAPLIAAPPNADQALAKAVSDYEAALAARSAPAMAPSRTQLASAPARSQATARPVAVSGGS